MKSIFFVIYVNFILFFNSNLVGQENSLALYFNLEIPVNKVEIQRTLNNLEGVFIGDTNKTKPLIIFIEGSQPIPIYMEVESHSKNYFLLPKEIFSLTDKYHYFVLSKPGIPLSVSKAKLSNYLYLDTVTNLAPEIYLINNNLDYYVQSYNLAINYLKTKNYIETSKITVMGHSQGSRIATKLISFNPSISNLIYLSCDPLGRTYSFVNSEFKKENSFYTIKEKLDAIYENDSSLFMGENKESWRSFSEILIDDILLIEKPIFVGYGSNDESCISCDIFKIMEYTTDKQYLTTKRYEGFDHNFFSISNSKKVNNWSSIMSDIDTWLTDK